VFFYPNFDVEEFKRNIFDSCSIREEKKSTDRKYIGMSGIGHPCERNVWYQYAMSDKTRPIDGRTARIFNLGRLVENQLLTDLAAAGYPVESRQGEFSDFDGKFCGHCDGIIYGPHKEAYILEIKSASSGNFNRYRVKGIKSNPQYYGQIQCYMGYSKCYKGMFIIENKDNCDLEVQIIDFDYESFKSLRKKAWDLLNRESEPPANKTASCYFCTYKPLCEGAENE
jgi:hypothetical protein